MRAALRHAQLSGRAVITFVVCALLGIGGLALAGGREPRTTAFSVDVPPEQPVASLRPGHAVCQDPIRAPAAFSGVRLWISPTAAPGTTLRVTATTGARGTIATGMLTTPLSPSTARLSHAVSGGSAVSVCVRNVGKLTATLKGNVPTSSSGSLRRDGRSLPAAATMVFLRPHSTSLLSALPTVFKRAALFRPDWVGSWTFWLLLVGVLAGFPLIAIAIGLATADEQESERS